MTLEYMLATKPTKELEAREKLRAIGIECRVAMRADFKRQKNQRRASLVLSPYFPRAIFAHLEAADFARLHKVNSVNMNVPPQIIAGQREGRRIGFAANLDTFFRRVDEEVRQAVAAELAADARNELIAAFTPGQAITALSGPFLEVLGRFSRITQAPHDPHPFIEAEMDLMGQTVTVKLDPLDVKAAD